MSKAYNIQLASHDTCTGCAACVSVCPSGSISMCEDREGFLQPHIDKKTCIGCHKCEKTCPILNPINIPTDFETQAYAAINKDEDVRMRSSSGGMFHALAKWTIEQGGVVFGARFNDQWDVVHDYTETIEGIEPFMRSKYVQSRVGDTYKQAKAFLEQGRWVLYSGTPCQIGGLHQYLGKDYERLIMVDLICHGVPSPKVWRTYLKETLHGDTLLDFNFRDKRDGWIGFQCVTTTTTTTRREQQMANTFFRGFLKNVYLRKSCYSCAFIGIDRISDITIADFWGVDSIRPEIDDDKGISAVLIHSQKGQNIIDDLHPNTQLWTQSIEDVIINNKSMVKSVPMPTKRSRFFFYKHFLPFNKLGFAINTDWLAVRLIRKFKKFRKQMNRKKKIGIVTITGSSNYGNKLQNFAVQKILQEMGYDAETIIDLRFKKNPMSWLTYIKPIMHYVTRIKYVPSAHKKVLSFCWWSRHYIKWSPILIRKTEDEKKLNSRYDGFLVGSDQIWGPYCPWDSSELAFFTFAERHKRIAFAPSFGTDTFPPERIGEYRERLNGFNKLSVRESNGAEIIKSLTGKEAEVLVDPTMVLNRKYWDEIAEPVNLQAKYILVYTLGELTGEYSQYINSMAKENGYKIIDLMKDNCFSTGHPGTFVGLIKNANYIVTDSFHGSVFAMIYHKPLVMLRRKGNENAMFTRLENLMSLFQLEPDVKKSSDKIYFLKTDWKSVDTIMEREKQKSLNYLKSALALI